MSTTTAHEQLVRLFCATRCGGCLGFISRDDKGLLWVEDQRERKAVPLGERRPVRYYEPFPIRDPRQMLQEGAPRTLGMAPLTCPRCERHGILLAGDAAYSLDRAEQTGRAAKLTVVSEEGSKPRPVERVDWTD